tara:strand:- start:309 stop:503 length:195 start_codon:yes stop_codon:yes gene_type:complete
MKLATKLGALITILEEAKADAEKVDGGKTGAPGTRLRKSAQTAKKTLDEIRKEVLELRKGGKEE